MKSYLIVLALVAVAHAAPQYFGPFAIPTVLPDGHLADTPEVAAAKVAHFAEHAKALASAPVPVAAALSPVAAPVAHFAASAPAVIRAEPVFANPVISPEGFVVDTAEVSKAKAIHYAAHAAALGAPVDPYLKYLEYFP